MLAQEAVKLVYPETYTRPEEVASLLARIRQEEPVIWVEPEGMRPFWLVTKAEDLRRIETQPEAFVAAPRPAIYPTAIEEHHMEVYGRMGGAFETLVTVDGARHRQLRSLGQSWFSPVKIKKWLPEIEAIAERFVHKMDVKQGECDFASDIAFRYPLRVINSIMGLPEELDESYLELTQKMFSSVSGDREDQSENSVDKLTDATEGFIEIYRTIIADRRKNPRDDFVSLLIGSRVDGNPISDIEIAGYLHSAATAGHDTTSASTASGLLELIRHPEQFHQLRNNLDLLPNAVEEFIRWAAPVTHLARTAVDDIELGDKKIHKGDGLMLMFASACHDESAFENANQFNITRKPNNHLAFGTGPHVCLGMHLARLEIATFFRALLPRLEHVELNGELSYLSSYFVNRLTSMPIKYRMKDSVG